MEKEHVVEQLVYNVSEEGQYAWENYGSNISDIQDADLKEKAEKAQKLADEAGKASREFLNAAEEKGYLY